MQYGGDAEFVQQIGEHLFRVQDGLLGAFKHDIEPAKHRHG